MLVKKQKPMTTRQQALACVKLALDKKGFNVVLLDVRPWKGLMDFIVVVSAQSITHAQTIGKYLRDELKKEGLLPLGTEGITEGKWVLLDYNDIIVHIFFDYVRDFYDLEGLWHDAPRISIPKGYYSHHAK